MKQISLPQIINTIPEFGLHIDNPSLFEKVLIEYGKVIYKSNAILNCINVFK